MMRSRFAELKNLKVELKETVKRYENDPTPENEAAVISIREIIGLCLAAIIFAAIISPTLQSLAGINTTGLPDSEVALIQICGIIVLVVFVALFAGEV